MLTLASQLRIVTSVNLHVIMPFQQQQQQKVQKWASISKDWSRHYRGPCSGHLKKSNQKIKNSVKSSTEAQSLHALRESIYKWPTYRYLCTLSKDRRKYHWNKLHTSPLILNDELIIGIFKYKITYVNSCENPNWDAFASKTLPFSLAAVIAVGHLLPHSLPAPAGSCSAWSACTDRWLWQATERERDRQRREKQTRGHKRLGLINHHV